MVLKLFKAFLVVERQFCHLGFTQTYWGFYTWFYRSSILIEFTGLYIYICWSRIPLIDPSLLPALTPVNQLYLYWISISYSWKPNPQSYFSIFRTYLWCMVFSDKPVTHNRRMTSWKNLISTCRSSGWKNKQFLRWQFLKLKFCPCFIYRVNTSY